MPRFLKGEGVGLLRGALCHGMHGMGGPAPQECELVPATCNGGIPLTILLWSLCAISAC